jgi:CDP-glycerol glycerophosphotransferase
VRPSDLLAPGAVAAVLAALDETAADVLVVGHEREDRLTDRKPGRHQRALAKAAEAGFAGPLADRPGLAPLGATVVDKVVRRDLLPATGATGPALTFPALLAAERVAALPAPVYVKRAAAVAPREDDAPAPVAAAYHAVLDGLPRGGREHALVLATAVRHELELLAAARGATRTRLLERMAATLREHGVPPTGDRVAQARLRLIARGATGPLGALDKAVAARGAAGRGKRTVTRQAERGRRVVRRKQLERHYAQARKRPIEPDLAVFAAYWYRGYSDNPKAIYEKARELVPGMRGVWVVHQRGAKAMPAGVDFVVPGTPEYYDVLATAKYFVNNVNFPNDLVKRPGTVHVMTHHGTPLKKMGMDLRDSAFSKMDFPALLRRCERWDYSVSSNPLSTLVWERVYPTDYESLETGYPRNDALANATEEDVARIRASLGIAAGQTAVLYAPTHREWHQGYVPVLDVPAVADGLGRDHVVLARAHYFYDRRQHRHGGRVVDVADHPSIEELCLAADVLVTDYSSLMFDYAVLDRPIVVHAPDWELYRATRGTYFDLMEKPPGVVVRTEDELVAALRAAGDEGRDARAAFREEFCPWDDGRASERVVRRVWLGDRDAALPPARAATR